MHPIVVVFFAEILSVIPSYVKGEKGDRILKFCHVTDVHLNPFYHKSFDRRTRCRDQGDNLTASYDAPYGRLGCDSPEVLVEGLLDAVKKYSDTAEFILLSGDLAGHKLVDDHGSKNVLKCFRVVGERVQEAFPMIPAFPIFGNHDLPGHNVMPNSSEWYETVLSYWAPLILCSGCSGNAKRPTTKEKLKKTFLKGGYYGVDIAGGGMVLLALNTLYWDLAVEKNKMVNRIADEQFIWMEDQLQRVRDAGKKALIMGHVPPVVDPYINKNFWMPQYAKRYVNIVVGKFHDIVAAQLYGHTHTEDFRLLMLDSLRKSWVLIAPSITPVTFDDPAFRVMLLDTKKMSLVDYVQYYLNLTKGSQSNPVWQEDYTFSDRYRSRNIFLNASMTDDLNKQLTSRSDKAHWGEYIFSAQVVSKPSFAYPSAKECILLFLIVLCVLRLLRLVSGNRALGWNFKKR